MNQARRKPGFTLIEVLIVVVIMAVLAATIIPQFSSSSKDAQDAAAQYNLHTLRAQLQLYRTEHTGNYPTVQAFGGQPSLPQLFSQTNAAGTIGTGASYPHGPYLVGELPKNPYDDSNYIEEITGTFPPAAATANGGWCYKASTGQICLNTDGHLTE